MQTNVMLGFGGLAASLATLILDSPNLRLHIFGAVLCLASLGQTFYQIWLWKHYPSNEPETVADATRYKTAIWFGITCFILLCVILCFRFLL